MQDNIAAQFMQAPLTGLLVLVTIFVSYLAFNNPDLRARLLFVPALMQERGQSEWHRFITAGFIHADWLHLAFNSFVLWEFGRFVELAYVKIHGKMMGSLFFLALYFFGLVAASTYSYFKHRDNYGYAALGASGAVSGVLFAAIVFAPLLPLQFLFLPFISLPAVVMGVLYLAYSSYMSRRGSDNIGHDAHFWGGVWGFFFTIALAPQLLQHFLKQIFG